MTLLKNSPWKYLYWIIVISSVLTLNLQAETREALYQDDKLAIYSHEEEMCYGAKLDVVYDVEHDQRESLFKPDFNAFISTHVVPIVKKNCYSKSMVKLLFYKKGETEYWDQKYIKISMRGKVSVRAHTMNPKTEAIAKLSRTPLHSNKQLTLFPGVGDWCVNGRLEVVYEMEHSERTQWITSHYTNFVGNVVRPIVEKYCGNKSYIALYFYKKGEADYWDKMIYKFHDKYVPATKRMGSKYANLLEHIMSQRAKNKYQDAKRLALGECLNSPFCELPGGIYLNAIYKNDAQLLKKLDIKIYANAHQIMKNSKSFIVGLADNYMYNYQFKAESCFQPNARIIKFYQKSNTTIHKDYYGWQSKFGGIETNASYRVNPEFFPLLNKVGNTGKAKAPEASASYFDMKEALYVLEGLSKISGKYDCNSNEIKQFERNLMRLTNLYL